MSQAARHDSDVAIPDEIREEAEIELRKKRLARNAAVFAEALALCEGSSDEQVYIIQMAEARHIKVGIARQPRHRLGTLQVGNPETLSIIAVVPGDRRTEKMIHAYLGLDRLQGEWFRWSERTERLVAYVTEAPKVSLAQWCRDRRVETWEVTRRK